MEKKDNEKDIWVIGDIHGCFDPFKELMTALNGETNKLIFLGDYIDFGPSSKEILDYLMHLNCEKVFLMGNHEQMMLDFVKKGYIYQKYEDTWICDNGGHTTIRSLYPDIHVCECNSEDFTPEDFPLEQKYIDFLEKLKMSHTETIGDQKFLFTHAKLNPNLSAADQLSVNSIEEMVAFCERNKMHPEKTLLWNREEVEGKYGDFILIHGHTPTNLLNSHIGNLHGYKPELGYPFIKFKDPQNKVKFSGREREGYSLSESHWENANFSDIISINLDTGCVYGNYLTALKLSEENFKKNQFEIIQVKNGTDYRRGKNCSLETIYIKN